MGTPFGSVRITLSVVARGGSSKGYILLVFRPAHTYSTLSFVCEWEKVPLDKNLPSLDVLHEDNHLLAVSKPAGMPVQGDESGDESLLDRTREWIRIKYQKPGNVYCGLVHRLDRPASGAIIFAKTDKAAGRLCEQFRNHTVEKIYTIIVSPPPSRPEAELNHYLTNDTTRRKTLVTEFQVSGAKRSTLHYRVLKIKANMAEIEVTLETGRKHQIRAQMSHIGHPIAGDLKYGASTPLRDGQAIALHALQLTVIHPTRKEPLTIHAPLPIYWPLRE